MKSDKVDVFSVQYFKKTLIGYLVFAIPLSLLLAILGFIEILPMQVNGQETYAWWIGLIYIFHLPLLSLFYAAFNWFIVMAGHWIIGRFKKKSLNTPDET